MTDFTPTLRHYCRNPRCRSKLAAPVTSPREAFCAAGCHSSFYLRRCIVCEGSIERKREDQKICRKAECRNAWRAGFGFGCYGTPANAKLASKTLDSIDPKQAPKADRPWRIVAAGPPVTAAAFHCASVPDSGEYERIEAKNRAALSGRRPRPTKVAQVDGVPSDWRPIAPRTPIEDDLSFPDFLRRAPADPPHSSLAISLREAA